MVNRGHIIINLSQSAILNLVTFSYIKRINVQTVVPNLYQIAQILKVLFQKHTQFPTSGNYFLKIFQRLLLFSASLRFSIVSTVLLIRSCKQMLFYFKFDMHMWFSDVYRLAQQLFFKTLEIYNLSLLSYQIYIVSTDLLITIYIFLNLVKNCIKGSQDFTTLTRHPGISL